MAIDDFEELPGDELFPDEQELKKKIVKLERQLVKFRDEQAADTKKLMKFQERALLNTSALYENQLEHLREQIRALLEKNLELSETSKIFVKGLQHLKQDGILVTQSITWERKGVHGTIDTVIARLAINGARIVAICPMQVTHQGETIKALIVVEHMEKKK